RFPARDKPSRHTIVSCIARLKATGSVLRHTREDEGVQNVNAEERILHEFERDPGNSTRKVATALDVSRNLVRRTLWENNLRPYHFQRVQQLLPADEQKRVFFCE
ncbi:hypothetical protein EAI_02152, partial [Harpegnathos saltator]